MITSLTPEHFSRSISPLGMTTYGVLLTDVCQIHRPEDNTVVFKPVSDPIQSAMNPCPERSSHIFIQAASEFCVDLKKVEVIIYANH
jgi:hypothetical protein